MRAPSGSSRADFHRLSLLRIAVAGALCLGAFAVSLRAEESAPASDAAGWTDLFNGKDLSGWKNYGQEKWYVENGEIVCESLHREYGYLGTEKTYKNFDLTVDFKQERDGNSGLFFRSVIPEGIAIKGWQAEVAPPGSNSGRIYESGRLDGPGRGWITPAVTPEQNAALKYGDWNTMRVLADGDHVRTWLNGVLVADLTDEHIGKAEGMIALQIHSGDDIKVRWRNLKIRVLP